MSTQEEAPALADLVRDAFLAADPGPSDVTDAAAQAVYGYLFDPLRDAEDPTALCAEAASGVLAAQKKHGAPVWHAARGALVGVLHAAVGHHLALEAVIGATTARLMTDADAAGGDFGAAAQGSVEGAIVAAEELGLDPTAMGGVAAAAALRTAADLGEGAGERVLHLVDRRVLGYPIRAGRVG